MHGEATGAHNYEAYLGMSVETVEERKLQSSEVAITGPLEEVLDAVEHYMRRYDPRGYGTRVAEINWHEGGNGALHVRARMTRSNSCD